MVAWVAAHITGMTTSASNQNYLRRNAVGQFAEKFRTEADVTLVFCEWHQLAASPETQDRRRAAMRTDSVALLWQLHADPEARVRQGVAVNPATDGVLLGLLAGDADEDVADTAAQTLSYEDNDEYRTRTRDLIYGAELRSNN